MVKELIKFANECNDASLASTALERATDYLIFLKPKNHLEDTHAVVRSLQKYGKPVPNGLLAATQAKRRALPQVPSDAIEVD